MTKWFLMIGGSVFIGFIVGYYTAYSHYIYDTRLWMLLKEVFDARKITTAEITHAIHTLEKEIEKNERL